MVRDSFPEKWIYKERTRVKHEILRKYLYAWIILIVKNNGVEVKVEN